ECQNASTDWRGEIQPLPVERLEDCATRCHAFDDFDAVEHGPGDPVPLGKHQDVARSQRFDRLVQLRTLHALPARQLLFEDPPATLCLEHGELPIEILMSCRHTRVADEHWSPRFNIQHSVQKNGTLKLLITQAPLACTEYYDKRYS